jgi:2'-5' RNA ligase
MPRERTKFTKDRPKPIDAVDAPWRLFTGIAITPQFREPLEKLLAICSASDLPIRWIGANAAHLTLQFIGEVPVEQAELLRMAFPRAGAGLHPFSLRGDGAGAFPSLRKPQVIWVGLKGDLNPLNRTHVATGRFLGQYDLFEEEEREFRPHITIGRSRRSLESPEINNLVALMRSDAVKEQLVLLEEPMTVSAVHLFRSHLSKGGATYETVATARFGP